MKSLLSRKNYLALALVIAAAAGCATQAQEKPIPPPTAESVLPPNINDNTPTAQVIKLVQAGVDVDTIKNFVTNYPNSFNLDADAIISLNDAGVPTDIINAMLARDKTLLAAAATPPPVPASTTVVVTEPPTEPVTVNYFYSSLTPYGSWVEVSGYGRCWRPTVVVYDNDWRPYCDRGRWVYTDCGWYWDSDYSWGVTFHYGRWFRDTRFGWCWYPDTQWAPSWVTFRSGGDYCGWAPLPPLAVFRPGGGFYYRGASVSVSFDFGLGADCFTFVSPSRFCDRHPRAYCVEPRRVTQVFQNTTIINNYEVNRTTIVNNGIPVTRVGDSQRHPIKPVQVASLPNAERQGWRGGHNDRRDSADNHNGATRNNDNGHNQFDNRNQPGIQTGRDDAKRSQDSGKTEAQTDSTPFRHGPAMRDNGNNDSNRRADAGPASTIPGIKPAPGIPPQKSESTDNHNNQQRGRDARDNKPGQQSQGKGNSPTITRTESPSRAPVISPVTTPQPVNPPPRIGSPFRETTSPTLPPNNGVGRVQPNNNTPREIGRPVPPAVAERSAPQNEWRPNRNTESVANNTPVTRPTQPAAEHRQFTPPAQNRVTPSESRPQTSPRAAEAAPRYTPPAAASAPSPSQNSDRNVDRNSSRGNDRGNDRSSDRGNGNSQRSDKDKDKK